MPQSLDPFVVHCHMPKTGGSALNQRLLFPRFDPARVQQWYRFVFERASRLPLRHRTGALRAYAATGHVPFGYLDALYPDAIYVSVFRDPVSRFLSFLSYVLATPDHGLRARLPAKVLTHADQDPDAFVAAVLANPKAAVVHGNVQTRLAAGAARLGRRPVEAEHLTAARAHLRDPRYIVGLQSELDGFLDHLDRALPGPPLARLVSGSAQDEKRGLRRISSGDLAPKTIAAIEDANALDCALLDAAARRSPARTIVRSPDCASAPCSSAIAGGSRSAPAYPAGTCPSPRPGSAPSAAPVTQRRTRSGQSSSHRPA